MTNPPKKILSYIVNMGDEAWIENSYGELWERPTLKSAIIYWRTHFADNKLPYKIHYRGYIYSARRLWKKTINGDSVP